MKFESEFQDLSPGGAISYVEVPNLQNNIDVVLDVIKYIYDHIMYAELNTKSDYCAKCGYSGEIKIVETPEKKLVWECPNCGCRDEKYLTVIRRTCGGSLNYLLLVLTYFMPHSTIEIQGNSKPAYVGMTILSQAE